VIQLRVLNVGEGDRKFKFDPDSAEERERAKILITEMLRLGYAIFVPDGERDGQPLYSRVTGFDPRLNEYIILDAQNQEKKPDQAKENDVPLSATKRTTARQYRVPAETAPAVGVARSAGGMSDRIDSIEASNREISVALTRKGLRRAAALHNQWAGIPIPLPEIPLVIEPRYPYASAFESSSELDEIINDVPDGFVLRNSFYSQHARRTVLVWAISKDAPPSEGLEFQHTPDKDAHFDGRIVWALHGEVHQFKSDVGAMYASSAWGIEQELQAQETLREYVSQHAFDQYRMTGMFVEQSLRSGIYYFFRRLRPTVAVSNTDGGEMTILATLCAHPIAYYAGTWAGAMCPTDDVIAHLMMMRGDEAFFWRRCNQHPAYRQESGL
jgi:hypothetical protein